MTRTHSIRIFSEIIPALALAFSLVGCGGGGGSGEAAESDLASVPAATATTTTTAEAPAAKADSPVGLWRGSTETGRAVTAFVLGDGTDGGYWLMYSGVDGNSVEGFIQGLAEVDGPALRQVNKGHQYRFDTQGVGLVEVNGSLNDAGALELRLAMYPKFERLTGTDFTSIKGTPTLGQVAGTYTGEMQGLHTREAATVVITEAGKITKTGASGCTAAGDVIPDWTELNIYWVSLTFDKNCHSPGWTDGIAYWDEKNAKLYAITTTSWDFSGSGYVFVGAR